MKQLGLMIYYRSIEFIGNLTHWVYLALLFFILLKQCMVFGEFSSIYGRDFGQVPEVIFMSNCRNLLLIFLGILFLLFGKMPEITTNINQQVIRSSRKKWYGSVLGEIMLLSVIYILIYYFFLYLINNSQIYWRNFITGNMVKVFFILILLSFFLGIICVLGNIMDGGKGLMVAVMAYLFAERDLLELAPFGEGITKKISFSYLLETSLYSNAIYFYILGILCVACLLVSLIFYKKLKNMDFNTMENM